MFSHWVSLTLRLWALSAGCGLSTFADVTITPEWVQPIFGSRAGDAGMQVADLDGDGQNELILTAAFPTDYSPTNGGQILKPDAQGEFEIIWQSPVYPRLSALRVFDADHDGDLDVVVAAGLEILVYDGPTRALVRTFHAPAAAESIRAFTVADLDGDGQDEIALAGTFNGFQVGTIYIADFATGAIEYENNAQLAVDVAIDDLDGDGQLELLIADVNYRTVVLSGATHTLEWTIDAGFYGHAPVANVDGDAALEFVGQLDARRLGIFDGQSRQLQREISLGDVGLDRLAVLDVTGDGIAEIVAGEAWTGQVRAFDGETGGQVWSLEHVSSGVTAFGSGDADTDGRGELLISVGADTSAPDILHVYDLETRQLEWQSMNLYAYFPVVRGGDFDRDGRPDLLLAANGTDAIGFSGPRYFVRDAISHELDHVEVGDGSNPLLFAGTAANLDSDPQDEFIFAGGFSPATIRVVDSITHAQEWSATLTEVGESGLDFVAVAVADIDRNGSLEVVATTRRGSAGIDDNTYLYVYDGATGAFGWRSPPLGRWNDVSELRIGNVDADPALELIAAARGGDLYILDGITRAIQLQAALRVGGLDLVSSGSTAVLFVARDDGTLSQINPSNGQPAASFGSLGTGPTALRAGNFAGGPLIDFLAVVGDRARLSYDGPAGRTTWTSEDLGETPYAPFENLSVGDFDWDGKIEFAVDTSTNGVRFFEIGDTFCPGDLNGDRRIDLDDLAILLLSFGATEVLYRQGDLDVDGDVDLQDLADLLGRFGSPCA